MRTAVVILTLLTTIAAEPVAAEPVGRMSDGSGSVGMDRCIYDLPSKGYVGVGYGVPPQNFMRPCHSSGTTREDQFTSDEEIIAEICWQEQAFPRNQRSDICRNR